MNAQYSTRFLLSIFLLCSGLDTCAQTLSAATSLYKLDGLAGTYPEYIMTLINYFKNKDTCSAKLPNTVLFHGPPGTGKTTMARALAKELGVETFYVYSAATIVDRYQGSGPQAVDDIYYQAQCCADEGCLTIIFIDEIDAICRQRSVSSHECYTSTLNHLLIKISEFKDNPLVLTILATNTPDLIDLALSSRVTRVEFALPDQQDRLAIIQEHLDGCDHRLTLKFQKKCAAASKGFSGRDLESVIRRAYSQAQLDLESLSDAYLWKQIKQHKKVKAQELAAQKKNDRARNPNRYFIQEGYAITTWTAVFGLLAKFGLEAFKRVSPEQMLWLQQLVGLRPALFPPGN